MVLSALALLSNAAVSTPAVHPAVAVVPPPSLQSTRGIPKTVTTGVRITIGADGRIDRCSVVSSSGWSRLDTAVCAILARSWIEEGGAMDADRRPGTHEISISWTPPRY
jgi:TonB family protein